MKKLLFRVFLLGVLVPLWIFLRRVYRDRIGAFGCFDDCFNIVAGYFVLGGNRLYADIFFNHQPLPAYLSAVIQYLTNPNGLYLLIYQHRMFLIYFSILANILLVLRFGWIGFSFALLYESTKGFLFGERFLAEAMIVYPLVYLFGMIGDIWRGKKLFPGELVIGALLTWFVVFSREPYVPLALVMFGYLIFLQWTFVWSKAALGVFVVVSAVTVGFHALPDYIFNVITVNASRPGSEENPWLTVFYPIVIFFGGKWNLFRDIEIGLSGLFWLLVFSGLSLKKMRQIVVLFVLLTLANIRPIAPGTIYYVAFHHLVWYGLFTMSIVLFLAQAWEQKKWGVAGLGTIAFLGITIWAFTSPQSYLHETVDRHAEFTTNFSQIFSVGGIIKTLSAPGDTLFLDEWDDLIYWQAKLPSAYRYSWYTSSMHDFALYRKAREDMFRENPPAFFYSKCIDGVFDDTAFPEDRRVDYVRLVTDKYPTCVFVHRSKFLEISDSQWQKAAELFAIQRRDLAAH